MSAKTLTPTFYVTFIAGFLIQTIWLYFFQKSYLRQLPRENRTFSCTPTGGIFYFSILVIESKRALNFTRGAEFSIFETRPERF